MRFNDMIATVLAGADERPEAQAAQWRQLVDLLAQRQRGAPGAAREAAFAFLRTRRDALDPRARADAASSLAGLAIDPELLVFFAEDRPEVAAPLLRSASLKPGDWLTILPRLGPTARALLRHRRDLPDDVRLALRAFGPSDLVLASGEARADAAAEAPVREGSQIRELVDRIEAYQRQRRTTTAMPEAAPVERLEALRWEAGPQGVIRWLDVEPRGAFLGQSLALIAPEPVAARAPFRDASLTIPGAGPLAGSWRISGVPFFDPPAGSFAGYRGTARRPRADQGDGQGEASLFGPSLPPDSLRQLVHELRTPLNAIMGFADMIEGEYLGPAAERYRARASNIAGQARRLLFAVDDLDTAARLETRRLDPSPGETDLAALLIDLHQPYDRAARSRGARVELVAQPGLPRAAVAPETAERMLARLLAATLGVVSANETIGIDLSCSRHEGVESICVSIDRPKAVAGMDEATLLDPVYSPAGDWPEAPAIGLGFALRLVRNLADTTGGALVIDDVKVRLYLPLARVALAMAEDESR